MGTGHVGAKRGPGDALAAARMGKCVNASLRARVGWCASPSGVGFHVKRDPNE
jgi:hypothetical protein